MTDRIKSLQLHLTFLFVGRSCWGRIFPGGEDFLSTEAKPQTTLNTHSTLVGPFMTEDKCNSTVRHLILRLWSIKHTPFSSPDIIWQRKNT